MEANIEEHSVNLDKWIQTPVKPCNHPAKGYKKISYIEKKYYIKIAWTQLVFFFSRERPKWNLPKGKLFIYRIYSEMLILVWFEYS